MNRTLYIKCNSHVRINQSKVTVKDLAETFCTDTSLKNKVDSLTVVKLKEPGDRKVLSVLFMMEQIEKELPGTCVENIGETDIIVDWAKQEQGEVLKIVAVSLIAFFGTAFTIMAFHNDIDIRSVFEDIYMLTSGEAPEGVGAIEISYCLGLFVGITVFFNHLGKKKLSKDPTPIAVAMHNYETDVNRAVVENADRRNLEKQVE